MLDNLREKLFKLGEGVLEKQLKKVIGNKGIEVLKEPLVKREMENLVKSAVANVEKRFYEEPVDKQLSSKLAKLPLWERPEISAALLSYLNNPSFDVLSPQLKEVLNSYFPTTDGLRKLVIVERLFSIFCDEIVATLPSAREKLVGLATLRSERHLSAAVNQLLSINSKLKKKSDWSRVNNAPVPTTKPIGRHAEIEELKQSLASLPGGGLLVIQGWPGVGKSTMLLDIAHDSSFASLYPDGVLWAALGEEPDLTQHLLNWCDLLGLKNVVGVPHFELTRQLRQKLKNRKILLLLDDIWETSHAVPFQVGGSGSAMVVTTRLNKVAQDLVVGEKEIFKLPIMNEEEAIKLLSRNYSEVVLRHPDLCKTLLKDFEYLPLAICVAGRLLRTEAHSGWEVKNLIQELRQGAVLLEADAPRDRIDPKTLVTPSVTALFSKSTDRLDPDLQFQFIALGAFAPKPASFDLASVGQMLQIPEPKPVIRSLIDRGLLESIEARFWMHALVAKHARWLRDFIFDD